MKLYVAGVRHHDPMGRTRLLAWLESLHVRETGAPIFIGIEYDQSYAQALIRTRPKLQQDAHYFFPNESSDVYALLALSLAYETDTHAQVFPNVEVLWLDPTTEQNAVKPNDLAYQWNKELVYFNEWLLLMPANDRTGNVLQDISTGIWSETDEIDSDVMDRDRQFADRLRVRAEKQTGGWAVAILGSSHAEQRVDSTVGLLLAAGLECEVTILNGP